MFCPRCGQEQISEQTRFCSRCGFLMAGVAELIRTDGNLPFLTGPGDAKPDSPRKRGLKQGLFLFLLTFLVVPIITILTIWAGDEPFLVVISAILLFVGGLLRMAYAWMFESAYPAHSLPEQNTYQNSQNHLGGHAGQTALPPQTSQPANSYVPPAGAWRAPNTDSLSEPGTVTESTTRLLQRDK